LHASLRARLHRLDRRQHARSATWSTTADLVVLDLGLPDMDGLDVVRQIRTAAALPIIILSSRTA
jgi:two-component system KDP operon response regulator KdpE